jgi:hypothetical protein
LQIEQVSGGGALGRIWFHLWLWFIPLVLTVLIVVELRTLFTDGFGNFPNWAVALGVVIAFGAVLPIPLMYWFGKKPLGRTEDSSSQQLEMFVF